MTKKRLRNDGLPYRVYERRGVREYSIGYKLRSGIWAFRLRCSMAETNRIQELRQEALRKAAGLIKEVPCNGSAAALIESWFERQDKLPLHSADKRAATTLTENRREATRLTQAYGHMPLSSIIKSDAYTYLDACEQAGRPEKGNKEISLMRTILEYGVRLGHIDKNPFDKVIKLKTVKSARYVTDYELELALLVGRALGGSRLIVALALKTAYLCVRRSVEVRSMTSEQITPEGLVWTAAKRQKSQSKLMGLIEWSDELRSVIEQALAVKRNRLAGTCYVFGNLQGQRYTKGGWKKTLFELMKQCSIKALADGQDFQPFSLQDCRPKGVSDKLAQGDLDVLDATLHTSDRMMKQTYDRRKLRVAKPVR